MALSNTATPRYYERFRDAVRRGEIPVCRTISMEMNRIEDLIADPKYYYDENAVEGYIAFCENELTLTDGSDLHLVDSFKLWAEEVYGWYYFLRRQVYVPGKDGTQGHYVWMKKRMRLVNKQYLIVARGAAKSLYATTHQAYGLICDTSTTQQITVAPTIPQADEVMAPFRTAIARARGPVFHWMTQGSLSNTSNRATQMKLVPTKRGIENKLNNSLLEVRPMSTDKLQGLKCKYATIDEWLSGDTRDDPMNAIEQSASKNDNYLIIATSSEGTVRNGIGDTIKMELMKILKGEYINPHCSIWWYQLDDIKEVNNPDMWVKAQPNLGITVKPEVYQLDVQKAEANPAARNDILAKRFGLPMEGYTYFFTYHETLCHPMQDFWKLPCSMGADMSMGDDFCSFTFLFPLSDGSFGVRTLNFITEKTYRGLPLAMHEKYKEFINEGSLIVMPGVVLDMDMIYEEVDNYIDKNEYDVCTFGYDPYNAKSFVERWEREHGPYGIQKVIQGVRTESVPLGELKKLAEERMLVFDQGIMQFCMGNAITLVDTNGNRKLYKQRADQKIDAVASMMDAFVAYKENKEQFY